MPQVAAERWRWTAESYERAAAAGVFGPEPRVELVEGEVFNVGPMLPGHAAAVTQVVELLREGVDQSRWVVRSQLPVRLDDASEPEPDVSVARGPRSRYRDRHPGAEDLALVVEVADTSRAFDRLVKVPRYARSGVLEVWLVSLPERIVHRFAGLDEAAGEYRVVETAAPGDLVQAGGLGIEIAADDILGEG